MAAAAAKTVGAYEAKTRFSELLEQVASGHAGRLQESATTARKLEVQARTLAGGRNAPLRLG